MRHASIPFALVPAALASAGGPITFHVGDIPSIGATGTERALDVDSTIGVAGLIGAPGAGSWDFTAIAALLTAHSTIELLDPAAAPCPGHGSNRVLHEHSTTYGVDFWSHFDLDGTDGLAMTAFCQTGVPDYLYTPPLRSVPATFTVGSSWSASSFVEAGIFTYMHSIASVVDGWGTVTLPGIGTHESLRINHAHLVQVEGFPAFHQRVYEWWVPGYGPVATIASEAFDAEPPAAFAVAVEVVLRDGGAPSSGGLGDVDGDGAIGYGDLTLILSTWGPCAGCPGDLDGDGAVGYSDLVVVLSNWS